MDKSPLRIGIACFPLIGGSGILATALGSELARRGHEVHFFSYARPVRLDATEKRLHFHLVELAHHPLFPCPDYTLPLAVKMAEVAATVSLDIIHAHYAVPNALAAVLAAQMSGVSPGIVTTLHGTDTNLLGQDPAYRIAIEYALARSDAVTTVSKSLEEQTREILNVSRAIEIIPNFFTPRPVTRSRETVRAELGVGDEFLILHMSNMRPGKRIDLLLQSFADMRTRDRTRLLILAGEPVHPYGEMIDRLGLREQIIIRENEAAVEDFISAADAGLYTSDYESFGLSIMETLYFGKPVVAFDVGGIPEVVGSDYPLYPFSDVSAIAGAMDKLVESPDLARSLGEQGRKHVIDKFSADNIVERYETLYHQVLSTRQALQT
ncbi:MAG TPA: N-acetyl-alpha-D-glucosaminyl L-malate synthase BshA [Chthoniobacterales bacterium]|nr:N-acetyl-alpha-D-glucosaminyl L-malate synthase BshA [Chthoniobacterales bacterium]